MAVLTPESMIPVSGRWERLAPARVFLDGKEIHLVSRCDPESGWVERYCADSAGNLELVTVNGEPEVRRETLHGDSIRIVPLPRD